MELDFRNNALAWFTAAAIIALNGLLILLIFRGNS
jgi:hypothetical protein